MHENLHVMRIPAKEILAKHGITYQEKQKGVVTWLNLAKCPICDKGGYQCGLSESFDSEGRSVKGFKCQHTDITDPKEFYKALGYSVLESTVKTLQKRNTEPAKVEASGALVDDLRMANPGSAAILQKRLRENKDAMDYLLDRGLTKATIEHFKLGLSKPYRNTDGQTTDQALAFPLFNRKVQSTKKNAYYNIPGLTQNPRNDNGWCGGTPTCSYAGNPDAKVLFVVEGFKDLWILWQYIQGTDLEKELLIVTSTNGKVLAVDFKDPAYWQRFVLVYFGHDNDQAGEQMVERLIGLIGRDAHRVLVPKNQGKDWTDYFKSGGDIPGFKELLELAPIASITVAEDKPGEQPLGLVAYNPVDINGSFHGGHLHYTVETLYRGKWKRKTEDGGTEEVLQEYKEAVVVRSDGAILTAVVQPTPKWISYRQQVIRLTDGTLIKKMPTASPYGSWSWPSIDKFSKAKQAGKKVQVRPLAEMVSDIYNYLCNKVWLPHTDDYMILALTVVVTYVQTVFDAVPLLMVNGPKGSGKSELGITMKGLCANGVLSGQGSAATIARVIDNSRGFVVFDDLEAIGNGKPDAQYSELIQALKLSYKKSTAIKLWTNVNKDMQVEELNFFGVKMINNTKGVDLILGSRMLNIQTRKRLPQEIESWENSRTRVSGPPKGLRDELHTWSFEACKDVDATYKEMYSQGSEREDEIAAPLRVIAALTGNKDFQSQLEAGLARQVTTIRQDDDPLDLLEEALHNLVTEGFREVSIQHLTNEMRKLVPDNYGKEHTTDIPEFLRPEWIGRQLRTMSFIEPIERRFRLYGMNLRAYTVAQSVISTVAAKLKEAGRELVVGAQKPASFCQGCDGCQYRNAGCSIMPRRLDEEGKVKLRVVASR